MPRKPWAVMRRRKAVRGLARGAVGSWGVVCFGLPSFGSPLLSARSCSSSSVPSRAARTRADHSSSGVVSLSRRASRRSRSLVSVNAAPCKGSDGDGSRRRCAHSLPITCHTGGVAGSRGIAPDGPFGGIRASMHALGVRGPSGIWTEKSRSRADTSTNRSSGDRTRSGVECWWGCDDDQG
jgi:hypothetical protein